MHFTRMGGYSSADVPIIVRGDGCYLEDVDGKRYLDALAGLFSVNIGYSFGEEMGQAALEQMRELPFYTNWSYAHPRAIELAAEVASLAPGDLNRVVLLLRRLGGGRVGLEARAPVLRRASGSRAAPLQGDRARGRVPRHDARRALDQRDPRAARAVRAARPRGASRLEHEPLPPAARGDRGGVHALPARRARADDRVDGPRDRLPRAHGAGAERGRLPSRRPRATGRACARSATATTSCSRPTR